MRQSGRCPGGLRLTLVNELKLALCLFWTEWFQVRLMGVSYAGRWTMWGLTFNARALAILRSVLTQESCRWVDSTRAWWWASPWRLGGGGGRGRPGASRELELGGRDTANMRDPTRAHLQSRQWETWKGHIELIQQDRVALPPSSAWGDNKETIDSTKDRPVVLILTHREAPFEIPGLP